MENYYAMYQGKNDVLIFSSKAERDAFVRNEVIVHPEIRKVSHSMVKDLIKGKQPTYDKGFGCLAVLA